jgi:hypothetical protein
MVQVTYPADSVEGVRIVVTPSTVSSTSTPVQISGTASGIGSPVGAYIDADGDGRLDATFAWPGPVSWTYPSQGYYSPRVVVRLANGTCHDSALDPAPVTVSAPPTLASVPGQFELPVPALDVAVERLGGLVLVLGSNGRVYVFSPAGAGAGSFPLTGVQSAAAIDCDENGDLYAVDRSQHLLLKFSRQLGYAPDSSFGNSGAVGGQGSGNGQFHAPFDVQCVLANGGTQVWVADRLNARLQSFNLLGEFQASLATGPDITLPVSLVADIGGYVTVVDGADGDLAVFETGGTRLAYRPNAISIDPNIVPRACVDFDFGALILSAGNRTMLRCERNGNTRTLIDLAPAIPVAAVNTPDGQTLVLTAGATRLSRLIQPEPIGESPVEVATRFFAAVNQGSDSIATGLVAPQAGQQLSTVLAHPVNGPAYRALAGRVGSITELSRTPRLASIHAMVDPGTPGAQPITLDLQRDEATQRWLLLGL